MSTHSTNAISNQSIHKGVSSRNLQILDTFLRHPLSSESQSNTSQNNDRSQPLHGTHLRNHAPVEFTQIEFTHIPGLNRKTAPDDTFLNTPSHARPERISLRTLPSLLSPGSARPTRESMSAGRRVGRQAIWKCLFNSELLFFDWNKSCLKKLDLLVQQEVVSTGSGGTCHFMIQYVQR